MTPRHILAVAAVVLPVAAALDAIDMQEQSYIDSLPQPVYHVEPVVTGVPHTTPALAASAPATGSQPVDGGSAATVTSVAERGAATSLGDTPPPVPAPGDCDAWAHVFAWYGATPDEVAFFVPRIIERESGCGRDTLNERTGDSGPCQLNPVHNRAGWFGRVEYGDGGWLAALHGLRTRVDTDNPAWVAACLTLYRVCGSGAWRPPYSCANRRLP